MLSKRIEEEINKQINAELWSAYMYLSMSGYFKSINLDGFANWMRVQFQEETAHALKFFDFISERGGNTNLQPLKAVPVTWKDTIEVFTETLKHEQLVTSLIHNLVSIAREEKDFATENMLQWFVTEQVEEEANADNILQQLKLIEGKGSGLFMLDRELKTRVFVDPTQTAN